MNDGPNKNALTTAASGGELALSGGTDYAAAMPMALALYLDDNLYNRVDAIADKLSKAQGVTPKHLMGKKEACFAVVTRAITWRLDPFAVAMATYQTPGGQIGFEGKLVHAIMENSGRLMPGGVRYEHYGDWTKIQGKFAIKESARTDEDGKAKKYAAPTWTDEDARNAKCGVKVIAHLKGELEPRTMEFDLIQAQPRNSTLWATDPMTQICYTAVRRFGSSVAPGLLMGVPFDAHDYIDDGAREPIDITPSAAERRADIPMPTAKGVPAAAQPAQESAPAAQAAAEPTKAQEKTQSAPAAQGTPAAAGDEFSLSGGNAEAGNAGARDGSKPADMGPKLSEPQKKMLVGIGKRKGMNQAQLDALLVEKFSLGSDEIPASMINDALALLQGMPDA